MSIASRINEIGVHLTKDWRSIEALTGEAEVDKNIENIASVLDNLWEEMPKVTGTGESLTLNTKKGKMKVNLLGNTSQYSTTGKNLLNESSLATYTMNGLTWKYEDSKIKISGQASSTYSQSGRIDIDLPAGTYTFSKFGTTSLSYNCWIYNSGGTLIGNTKLNNPVTINEDATKIELFVGGLTSGTSYSQEMNFMVSTTSGEYEPYTNGASPNPDYPQDIHTINGDNEVVVCGKNIANLIRSASSYTGGGTQFTEYQYFVNMARDSGEGSSVSLTSATTDTIVVKGRYNQGIGFPRKCKPNTYYSLQATSTSADARVFMSFFDSTGTFISGSANDTIMQRIKQAPANAYWVIPIFAVTGSSLVDTTFTNIMLEESNTINTYEPYTSTSYPIHLGEYELCKISTYQDKFIRNSGKNLWDEELEYGGYNLTTGAKENTNYYRSVNYIPVKPNTNYSLYKPIGMYTRILFYDSSKTFISAPDVIYTNRVVSSFTSPSNAYYMTFHIDYGSATYNNNIMLVEGTYTSETIPPYEPYGNGDWYLEKKIGKIVLDGSEDETWFRWATNTFYITKITDVRNALSNYYTYNSTATGAGQLSNGEFFIHDSINNNVVIFKNTGINDSIEAFKIWLSTHNTIVYYVLATPTYTQITGTLKDDLEAAWRANSYKDTTNISQVNNDLPFNLSVTALGSE